MEQSSKANKWTQKSDWMDSLMSNSLNSNGTTRIMKTSHLLYKQNTPRSWKEGKIFYSLIIEVKRGRKIIGSWKIVTTFVMQFTKRTLQYGNTLILEKLSTLLQCYHKTTTQKTHTIQKYRMTFKQEIVVKQPYFSLLMSGWSVGCTK